MSYELLYTSAARGLKPGSQGFCVVVSTQGLATNLADRLESLSGYRHVFPAQDAQAALNPIVWSHLRLNVAGRNYHVLSRIAAAGLDYTQRSNKIAHHIALEAPELIAAGPAALLSAPGFMAAEWDGQATLLPRGRPAPTVTTAPAVCRAWQTATGDAGWGGVLAESAAGATVRPVLLIFNPGTDVLGLIAESLALLPAERRWQVTFSSYYTRLPAGVDCQWRGLVAGSPEALSARHVPGALIIDLTQPLPAAQGGSLVAAARTGRVVAEVKSSPVSDAHAASTAERGALAAEDANTCALGSVERRGMHWPLADVGIELSPPPQASEALWLPPVTHTPAPKPKPRWPVWLALAVAILLCVASGLVAWHRFSADKALAERDRDLHPTPPRDSHADETLPSSRRPVDKPPKVRPARVPDKHREPDESEPATSMPDPPDSLSPDEPSVEEMPPDDPDAMIPDAPPVVPQARTSLESIPAYVELPSIGGQQTPQALFSLPAAALEYSLKLRGPRMADGAQLALKRDGEGSYAVLVEFNSAVGGSERIARLDVRDQAVDFHWEPLKNGGQRARWRELKNQILRVRCEGIGERIVALRAPEHATPLQLALSGKPAESSWDLDAPPAGEYIPTVSAGDRLNLTSRGRYLSVNLRSEPVATPVKLIVDVIPHEVLSKHTLQTRLKGSVRLTYRGVQISREHLKADDPDAMQPTAEPEPITPEALHAYMAALGLQIHSDEDKLKALPAPPPGNPPPGKGPPPPPSGPPPTEEQLQERKQLMQSLRRDREYMRQAVALNHLFAVLQGSHFDFRVTCDIDGHPICLVSTIAADAPLVSSANGQ